MFFQKVFFFLFETIKNACTFVTLVQFHCECCMISLFIHCLFHCLFDQIPSSTLLFQCVFLLAKRFVQIRCDSLFVRLSVSFHCHFWFYSNWTLIATIINVYVIKWQMSNAHSLTACTGVFLVCLIFVSVFTWFIFTTYPTQITLPYHSIWHFECDWSDSMKCSLSSLFIEHFGCLWTGQFDTSTETWNNEIAESLTNGEDF